MKKYIKPELLVTDFNLNDILTSSTEQASLMTGIGSDTGYRDLGDKTYTEIFGS